jgi:hypothetical protein
MGGGIRLSILGAIFSEMDRCQSSRDLRHPSDWQGAAS